MKRFVISLLILMLGSVPLLAEEVGSPADARIDALATRLALSDAQREEFEPIMRDSMAKRGAILAKYGIDPEDRAKPVQRPNFRQARAMRSEMQGVQKDLFSSLEGVLTQAQLDQLARLQEEQRAAMRQRMLGG